MPEYIAGETEDDVIKKVSNDIDLSVFINEFIEVRQGILNLEQHKETPDQETLDFWNMASDDRNAEEKARLDNKAEYLYLVITPIRDAGLLPGKYEDKYQQLKNYVDKL